MGQRRRRHGLTAGATDPGGAGKPNEAGSEWSKLQHSPRGQGPAPGGVCWIQASDCLTIDPVMENGSRTSPAQDAEAVRQGHWAAIAGPLEGVSSMLILTRRVGETLMIGDDVTVTVLGVKGNQVRLGVDAPKHVAVHREEIYRRIQREDGQPDRAVNHD